MNKITDVNIILNFYKENYENQEILIPKEDYIKTKDYYGFYEKDKLIVLIKLQIHYDSIAEIGQFVVHKDYRKQGYAKKAYKILEKQLKQKGIRKIIGWIISDNFISIFLFLKLGFLIEGLARENLPNQNVYLCGKSL